LSLLGGVMAAPRPIASLLGSDAVLIAARIVLTCPFWISGLTKLGNWPSALGEMEHFGLSPAGPLAALVIALQLGGSAAIIAGRWTWLAAGALGVFTGLATLIAHAFWTYPAAERFAQTNTFFEHMSIIAGLALAAILADGERRQ